MARRAGYRCEYCLIRQEDTGLMHEVDHIVGRKHGGLSTLDNLAYACAVCNRLKGSDVASVDPDTGEVVRPFHPRRDQWNDHFYLDAAHVMPRTRPARMTIRVLRLNSVERLAERRLLQELDVYPRR